MRDFARNNFITYRKDDFLSYAMCPIRGEIFLPDYKPEEKVRLSIIYFLTGCSDIFPELVRVLVENDRLDISLYNKALGEIASYHPPVLIIETKREDYTLIDAYEQLAEYLHTSKTDNGLLFNLNQAFKLTKSSNGYDYVELFEPSEIVQFIITSVSNQNKQYEEEKMLFLKAKNGDFESFKILALKYRRNKRVVFKVTHNGNNYLIDGHLFEFSEYLFKYTRCGYDTKSENKPSFNNKEFLNLESICRY